MDEGTDRVSPCGGRSTNVDAAPWDGIDVQAIVGEARRYPTITLTLRTLSSPTVFTLAV